MIVYDYKLNRWIRTSTENTYSFHRQAVKLNQYLHVYFNTNTDKWCYSLTEDNKELFKSDIEYDTAFEALNKATDYLYSLYYDEDGFPKDYLKNGGMFGSQ